MKIRLTHCLERASRLYADHPAIVDGEDRRNWKTFRNDVATLAGALSKMGVSDGARVAVLANNSSRYLELYYAIMWAGGVIVPLNTRLAAPEIIFQLEDADVRIVFCGQDYAQISDRILSDMGSPPVVIGIDAPLGGTQTFDELRASGEIVPDAGRGGEDLAGIFFTGGTTGLPKGVMLSHRSLHAMSMNFALGFSLTQSCVNLHAAAMFHVSAVGIFFATMVGGVHVFTPSLEAGVLIDIIERERVTHTFTVPAIIDRMTRHPRAASADLSSLQILGYGGSAIPVSVIMAAQERFPRAGLSHGYGMTEVPALTLLGPEDHMPGADPRKLRSVGRPMVDYDVRVVDPSGRECPPHTPGEIIAQGPNMMLGYWNRPEETSKAIGSGWMHTGDVGYYDEDGYLYISDRIKDMIVTGAENVYSIEVEDVLYRHPDVNECAVIGVPDEKWGERVHAIVVPEAGRKILADELIRFCRQHIAGYKCPKSVEIRTVPLPRSAAGKVLKVDLRKIHSEGV